MDGEVLDIRKGGGYFRIKTKHSFSMDDFQQINTFINYLFKD